MSDNYHQRGSSEHTQNEYLSQALKYQRLGFVPLPKKPNEKRPLGEWSRYQTEKPTAAELERLFKSKIDGVCLIQGPHAGTFVLDIDVDGGKRGNDSLHDLQMQHDDLPETVTALTPTGGQHLYFKYPDCLLPTKANVRPGIDVRAMGGLVVAPPSIHPKTGTEYRWLKGHFPNDMEPAEAPQWLIDVILNASGFKQKTAHNDDFNHSNDNKRKDGREEFMYRLVARCLRESVSDVNNPPSVDEVFGSVWPIYEAAVEPRDADTLEKEGRGESQLRTKIEYALRPERLERILSGGCEPRSEPKEGEHDHKGDFIKGTNGKPLNNLYNARLAISGLREFRYDEMASETVVAANDNWALFRSITDDDVLNAQIELQRGPLSSVSKETVHHAILVAAKSSSFHPIRDDLNARPWDGVCRLDSWLSAYMGADPTEYAGLVGRKFLISMVARIFQPGCQVDHMLILEGPQGCGKSACCRILAGKWFSDAVPADIRSKDTSQHIGSKWLIEMSELAVMYKREAEELKAFISRREEIYRRPYDRVETKAPRQCVFIGTTNAAEYLRDSTGGRRFWPVTVKQCDFKLLEEGRDQLFAEAVHRYKADEKWWPETDQEKALLSKQQEARREVHPWEEPIMEYLEGKDEVSLSDIFGHALVMEMKHTKHTDKKVVTDVLRSNGWEQHRTSKQRVWRKGDTG